MIRHISLSFSGRGSVSPPPHSPTPTGAAANKEFDGAALNRPLDFPGCVVKCLMDGRAKVAGVSLSLQAGSSRR